MAIDLATATTANNLNESIFDNPIPNHRTVPEAPIKTSKGKTMKLESVQVVANGGSANPTPVGSPLGASHLAMSHHKGFIEQIRRSITFGGVTNLQPLSKLWFFRRQSLRRQPSTIKTTRGDSHLRQALAATKLDSNGNGVSAVNGHRPSSIKAPAAANGAVANGHSNGHVASNETNCMADQRTLNTSQINCDLASNTATYEISEVVLDKQATSSSAERRSNVTVDGHEGGVVNNDNGLEAVTQRLQNLDDEHNAETIEMVLVTGGHYGDLITSTPSVDSNCGLQLCEEIDNGEAIELHLELDSANELFQKDNCLDDAIELQAMTSSSSDRAQSESTASCVSLAKDRATNSIDSDGSIAFAGAAAQPATFAVPLTQEQTEQILESLRQVVRVSTKTDLSKRASISEVFDLLDKQMRSLRPRTKPKVDKTSKMLQTEAEASPNTSLISERP